LRGSALVLLGDGFPLGQNHTGGVNLEAFDINNDGGHELIVSPNRGAPRRRRPSAATSRRSTSGRFHRGDGRDRDIARPKARP
jgi:hypothetical protein